jgi:hypothetical protein
MDKGNSYIEGEFPAYIENYSGTSHTICFHQYIRFLFARLAKLPTLVKCSPIGKRGLKRASKRICWGWRMKTGGKDRGITSICIISRWIELRIKISSLKFHHFELFFVGLCANVCDFVKIRFELCYEVYRCGTFVSSSYFLILNTKNHADFVSREIRITAKVWIMNGLRQRNM